MLLFPLDDETQSTLQKAEIGTLIDSQPCSSLPAASTVTSPTGKQIALAELDAVVDVLELGRWARVCSTWPARGPSVTQNLLSQQQKGRIDRDGDAACLWEA
ncbi:MAG: hypothetical protein IMW90_20330 [Thermogemmatispora sp.]|uniref:hypothetical protein n=1 Tax=Thermogemmatispora sp. TaxID=1968838 RepID=UPI0019E1C74C|nr:hypothetical protein [Thermogemmatispora sp.]MBE3568071.1 hypothetical protein [Thermogemmatispora sp.]